MSNLLEHIPDTERVLHLLRAAHRKLAAGGGIHLAFPPAFRILGKQFFVVGRKSS